MISFRKVLNIVAVSIILASCNYNSEKQIAIGSDAIVNPNGRNDQWGFIGPGGGGAMFNPAINPSDSN
ncbi:MAG: hypothetical protein KAI45_05970, partial [Melioribacteraceae bacterium]|nr:hypothetical protein [Melioribacteraceae bacterium]